MWTLAAVLPGAGIYATFHPYLVVTVGELRPTDQPMVVILLDLNPSIRSCWRSLLTHDFPRGELISEVSHSLKESSTYRENAVDNTSCSGL